MRLKTKEELNNLLTVEYAGETYYFSPTYPLIGVSLSLRFVRRKTRRHNGQHYIAQVKGNKHEIAYINDLGHNVHVRRSKVIADALFISQEEGIRPTDRYFLTSSIVKQPDHIRHSYCGADLRFGYRYKLNDDNKPLSCRELARLIFDDFDIKSKVYFRFKQRLQTYRDSVKLYHGASAKNQAKLKSPPEYIVVNGHRIYFIHSPHEQST